MKTEKNIFGYSAHLTTEQMLNYLRGQTTRQEAHVVEHHLADCEFCSDALEGLKKLEADTNMLNLTLELQKMAKKRRLKRQKLFSRWDLISVAAVCLLIFFLILVALVLFWKK